MNTQPTLKSLHQSGFSLVELMVALVLGLVLTGGVINIYISSKQTYRMQDNQSRLQENGRFALQFLTKDLRMASYMGCYSFSAITPTIIANTPTPTFSANTAIQGFDYTSTSGWPTVATGFPPKPGNVAVGTSVIVVSFAAPSGVTVFPPLMPPTSATIQVSSSNIFNPDDTVFITDCSTAHIFHITNVVGGGGGGFVTLTHGGINNSPTAFGKTYSTDAMVMTLQQKMFYIGYISGTACPCALYRQTVFPSAAMDRLVDNVQNMQITYGVDTTNTKTASQYMAAASVTDWSSVVSARVNLLVTTPDDNLVDVPQSLPFNGGAFAATDRRLYSSFSDTITFRNRAP